MPRKVKTDRSFERDWQTQADTARNEAGRLPHGAEREELIRKARQLDTAVHMREWITSPGLRPPSA